MVLCVIAGSSLKFELVKFCLLSMSLNILISLHVGICAQSHAPGKNSFVTAEVFIS